MSEQEVLHVHELADEALASLAVIVVEEITKRVCHSDDNARSTQRLIRTLLAIDDLPAMRAPPAPRHD